MDLPATSQPVQKSPQAGEPPEVQGSGGKGLTLLWNSCLSESYHLKNVSYTKGCTKNFFSLFCFHLSPSGPSPVGCFRPGTRAYVGRALCTQINTNATHIHMAHTRTHRDTHLCKRVETPRYTCGHDTQIYQPTAAHRYRHLTRAHMDTCTHPGEPDAQLFLFCSFGFSDSWCEAHSTPPHTPAPRQAL